MLCFIKVLITIFDIHSHILPGIDDGSTSVEESIEMLKMLKTQGVTDIVATPHFKMSDPNKSIDKFIKKRNASYEKLMDEIKAQNLNLPKIYLGAEVLFTMDLIEAHDQHKLCIEGTDIMLIELPYHEWQSWIFRMLDELCSSANITPIIAHVDRYVKFISTQKYEELFKLNYETQINADFVENRQAIKKLKKWIKSGQICYVGSDCHGKDFRPPMMDIFDKKINRIAGKRFVEHIEKHSNNLLDIIREQ